MGTIRIGIDGRELEAGVRTGIGRYTVEILRAASQTGLECVVYREASAGYEAALPGVTYRTLGRGWTQWWDQVRLPRELDRDGIEVFLSPYYKAPIGAPCPVVLTIHDLFFIDHARRASTIRAAALSAAAKVYAGRAAAVIADSEYSKRAIVARLKVPEAKITVIPVALGEQFKPQPLSDGVRQRYGIDGRYLLYLGNFKPHKNLPRLLQAYAALPAPLQQTHRLVLAGGDRERRHEFERLADRLNIGGRVRFPGFIDEADLPALYGGCSLFVLPSLEEGFGLPALEAMACGAPVAATNHAAVPEVVGEAATLFDPEDIVAMTKAMNGILSRGDDSENMRQRGFQRAAEFTAAKTAGRVISLLRRIGEGRG